MTDREQLTVDVVIPVYKPGQAFDQLMLMLTCQTYPVSHVVIMNTEQAYWKDSGYENKENIKVHHVTKQEFDHGATRNRGESYSQADIVIFMTDDAMPKDRNLIEELVKGFKYRGKDGQQVAMVYARQEANQDCRTIERYTRSFNYPDKDCVKTKADLPYMGIKTFFASNVCCAYDRQIFAHLGRFTTRTIFNEDMIFAAKAIDYNYAIVYKAEATVIHSHNYNGIQQFHRNFDMAVSQADHPEVFGGIKSEGEGIKLVKHTASYLVAQGLWYMLPELVWKSGCKYLGYRLGKSYKKLPRKLVLWCSMNTSYWQRTDR